MKVSIIAVGTKMPVWVQTAYSEYEKRLPREWKPSLVELSVAKRAKHDKKQSNIEKFKEEEGANILSAISADTHMVALDVLGKAFTTEALSGAMSTWQFNAKPLAIVIGGPDGLSEKVLARAQQRWSLSALTLPHPLVRVVLIEQLYRGWTILQNHPYHK